MEARADVLVIGAGLAGLAAAVQLRDAGLEVRVLEARERPGGRLWSAPIGDSGATFDLGGQWIGPGQPRVRALVESLGIATFPTHVRGTKILDLAGRVSTYRGEIPSLPVLDLVRLHLLLRAADRLIAALPSEEAWTAPEAARLDALTVREWQQHRTRSPRIEAVLAPAVRTIFGAEPDEVSLLHFAAYLRSGSGLMAAIRAAGGFQQDRIRGGAQQLAEGLAARLGPERIRYATPIRAVETGSSGVTARGEAGAWSARRVILAIPLGLARRLRFDPALPSDKAALLERVTLGATLKCHALYRRPFWRERGLSGEVVSDGPIAVVYDNTSADGGQAALVAFVVGAPARSAGQLSAEQRQALVVSHLTRWFGREAAAPTAYRDVDWSREAWSEGCPISLFPRGVLSALGPALRAPTGNLHWAGTETATRCMGYMEGALESGARAASEVLGALAAA